jgi:hypothetical protein
MKNPKLCPQLTFMILVLSLNGILVGILCLIPLLINGHAKASPCSEQAKFRSPPAAMYEILTPALEKDSILVGSKTSS